jgi:hypothetical protein
VARIFINYRRGDTSSSASRIYEWLSERYGEDQVFMDVDAIEPGLDWAKAIDQAIGSADLVLALIGGDWLGELRRRAADEDDFMRFELETALQRDIRVIPVLVEGVTMPSSDDLPESLKSLTRRQAFEVRDERFRYDKQELLKRVDRALGLNGASPQGGAGAVAGAQTAAGDGAPARAVKPVETADENLLLVAELAKWNWGAFLLGPIWGLGNNVYRAFMVLIPFYGIYEWVMLGRNGNRLAWAARPWESVESFHKTQRKWAMWGIIVVVLVVLIAVGSQSGSSSSSG